MSKLVEIKPNPNFHALATGSFMITGEFKDAKGKLVLDAVGIGRAITVPPFGMLLQPDIFPLHADIIKAAEESPQFKAMLGYAEDPTQLNSNQRFYLHNQEVADQKQYTDILEVHALTGELLNMDKRIVNFAKLFGIIGDEKSCKNKLVELASNDKDARKRITEHFNNPDRLLLEVIYASLEKGNPTDKKGLYAENGYYFYMGNAIGYGIEKVIDWAKEEKDIYAYLKEDIYPTKKSGKNADKA